MEKGLIEVYWKLSCLVKQLFAFFSGVLVLSPTMTHYARCPFLMAALEISREQLK